MKQKLKSGVQKAINTEELAKENVAKEMQKGRDQQVFNQRNESKKKVRTKRNYQGTKRSSK